MCCPATVTFPAFRSSTTRAEFYYSKLTADGPRAYYHAMGAAPAQDPKIFGDGYGPDKILGVGVSQDGRYLIFTVFYGSACDKSEVYFQDLKTGGPIVPMVNTVEGCFQGDIADNTLYLQTNWKAPKWRVLAVPLATPSQDHWKEIVPEGESRLEDFRLAGGKIVAQYSHNAASEMKIFDPDGAAAGASLCRNWVPWQESPAVGKAAKSSFPFSRSPFQPQFFSTIWQRGQIGNLGQAQCADRCELI